MILPPFSIPWFVLPKYFHSSIKFTGKAWGEEGAQNVVIGESEIYGRESRSCLGRVFNFKFGSFTR